MKRKNNNSFYYIIHNHFDGLWILLDFDLSICKKSEPLLSGAVKKMFVGIRKQQWNGKIEETKKNNTLRVAFGLHLFDAFIERKNN